MATTSQAVADAWRTIATVATLPWWTVAALSAAAEAYESQARDWSLRTPRPAPTPYPRAQPQPAPDDDPPAPLVPQPTNGVAHRAAQDDPVFWPNT
ncbi:MAG TPA: hypothetical protein VFV67_11105 [Actinophytocola sp.]|uniref:hypothetical protein n=1 Tax=Actinophytocola sp. TaxID=1872138 RepID=UPI002DB83905|nr:hypothetical protein [Actinophytocola sp.]HEU5471191.1 hypothetical protein [Actinophytocola sp.]